MGNLRFVLGVVRRQKVRRFVCVASSFIGCGEMSQRVSILDPDTLTQSGRRVGNGEHMRS
jgi:hypothetical protein